MKYIDIYHPAFLAFQMFLHILCKLIFIESLSKDFHFFA